jgi:hypothetical protein
MNLATSVIVKSSALSLFMQQDGHNVDNVIDQCVFSRQSIEDATPTLQINEIGLNKKNPDFIQLMPLVCWKSSRNSLSIQPTMQVFPMAQF